MECVQTSNPQNALIVFIDIIDSSQYSSILNEVEYANKVLDFRKLFKKLGKIYFPDIPDDEKDIKYCNINTIGDEGTIFYVDPLKEGTEIVELVFKSVKFAFELKAKWKLLTSMDSNSKKIKIGIGIHFGKIIPVTTINNGTNFICDIVGYSINYAKRIESCSRDGEFSWVFLSKEAASLIEGVRPIVLSKISLPIKGIANKEEMLEVRSVFFDEFPLERNDHGDHERFLDFYSNEDLELLREPWLKGLVASIIDSQCNRVTVNSMKNIYMEKLSKFVWRDITEDDPIILFRRADECEQKNEYTMMLNILREIVKNYPAFIYARKKLVKALIEVANSPNKCMETIFARDIAVEFLNYYPQYLSEEEKIFMKNILQ